VGISKKIKEVHHTITGLEWSEKVNLLSIGATLFLLFFSYPFMRTTTTSLLLTHHGVKASPYAWIYSVLCLSIIVSVFNHFQKKIRAQRLYLFSTLVTCASFLISYSFFKTLSSLWAYPLYVLKEVYIVMLVHSVLGHLNASVHEEQAKVIYGPLGAVGSIGGILGAFSVSAFVQDWGEQNFLYLGVAIIILTGFVFLKTKNKEVHLVESKSHSPLTSIKGIKSFVFSVAAIVILSQFVINIGNYQFNIYLNDAFSDSLGKTQFLGQVYGWINSCSLLIQVLLLPILLKFVPPYLTHLAIPLVYGLSYFVGMAFGDGLMPMAITFVVFKGLDYSLFGAAKELLYYALTDIQKYGAKYVADMISYRLAKGVISLVLIKLPSSMIGGLLGVSVLAWIICLVPLLRSYKKLHLHKKENS
jgi:AAA family ATP:ADP antiporter